MGFGTPSIWGAGGIGANAPGWLKSAFGYKGAPDPVAEVVAAGNPNAGISMGAPAPASGAVAPGTVMPPLPAAAAPTEVAAATPAPAAQTFGDKIGAALWGDNAGAMKSAFGPGADPKSASMQGLGLMGKAIGGGDKDAQFNRDAATITPSSISQDDLGARMAGASQLMATLLNKNKRPMGGIRMG